MDLSYLAEMTISEETQFLTVFEQQLEHDVGEAARACLLRGVPIYYAEKNTPEGCVIKEGRQQNGTEAYKSMYNVA